MDDLISRKAAIDAINALHEKPNAWLDSAADTVRVLPSAQTEQRWIPVTERLPEEDGTYIVSGVWGSGKKQVGECKFYVHDGCLAHRGISM